MQTLKLTQAQKNIEIQEGSIYVKVQNYYTATVRNLESFVNFLNENKETLCKLVIENVYNVSNEFLQAVKEIISKVNNPAPKKIKASLKLVSMNDKEDHQKDTTNYWSLGVEAKGEDREALLYKFADYCQKRSYNIECCYCPSEGENEVFEIFSCEATEDQTKGWLISEMRWIMKAFKKSLK